MRYSILECNLERLQKHMRLISKKCMRYGLDFRYEEVGEEYREIDSGETDKDGNPVMVTARFVIVEAEGTARVNGWEFIATLEKTDAGNLIKGYQEGIEIPGRYYNADCVCEHCQTKRMRKNTYIVRNTDTGEFKQIGKTCLKEYTCGLDANGIASYISAYEELIEGEKPHEGSGIKHYYDVDEALCFLVECIRIYGYTKRDPYLPGRCTAERASDYMMAYHHQENHWTHEARERDRKEMKAKGFDHNNSETRSKVESAVRWCLEKEDNSNYMHNLKTAVSLKYDDGKAFGILASLFPAYDRNLEYEAQRKAEEAKRIALASSEKNSEYVGNPGDRVDVEGIHDWRCLTSWETQYGTTYVYKFVALDGTVYTWKTGKDGDDIERMLGDDLKKSHIRGTVKGHKEYRGIKQTELTRCKIS